MASQTAQVSAEVRSELGSRANRRLRLAGKLPGVIYGHKEAIVPVTLPRKEVVKHLDHGTHLFDLTLSGKNEKVLIKDVQYDHLGIEVLHVDFARVSLDEKVEVTVQLELKGTPKGEEEGGVLTQLVAELQLECLVTDIPAIIRHNVSEMGLDSDLLIKDLKLPPGVKCLQDEDLMLAQVREIKEEEPAPTAEAEASAEPEVIGRKPEDGEAAAEGGEEK